MREQDQRETMMGSHINEIQVLNKLLGSILSKAAAISDRLFGPDPQVEGKSGSIAPASQGSINIAKEAIDECHRTAEMILHEIEKIDQL